MHTHTKNWETHPGGGGPVPTHKVERNTPTHTRLPCYNCTASVQGEFQENPKVDDKCERDGIILSSGFNVEVVLILQQAVISACEMWNLTTFISPGYKAQLHQHAVISIELEVFLFLKYIFGKVQCCAQITCQFVFVSLLILFLVKRSSSRDNIFVWYIILTTENSVTAGSVVINHISSSCFAEESENFPQLAASKTQLVQKILGRLWNDHPGVTIQATLPGYTPWPICSSPFLVAQHQLVLVNKWVS